MCCGLALDNLQKSEKEPNKLNAFIYKMKCLENFQQILQVVKNVLKHPTERERIFTDPIFSEAFTRLVGEIKTSKIVESLENESVPTTLEVERERQTLVDSSRSGLLRSDIYLASRLSTRDNKQKTDEQR